MQEPEAATSLAFSAAAAPDWMVVIGANTGGPQALAQILPQLPADFPGTVVVVQQMGRGFTRVLADQLSHSCRLPVYEPNDGDPLQASRILMTPGPCRMTIEIPRTPLETAFQVCLEDVSANPRVHHSRTNDTMTSVAQIFGSNSVGVVLTGIGNDGCEGMRAISEAGGMTIAQDEASSIVHDLPSAVIGAGVAREVLPLWKIADRIIEIVTGDKNAAAA